MPLTSAALRGAISSLFEQGTMPYDDAIFSWIKAYSSYTDGVIAGPVLLATPLVPSAHGEFSFDALDAALRSLWMSAVWVGPGVVAVTSLVPPVQPFLAALTTTLNASFDRDLAPTLLSEALHTYTLSIAVTVTPATGTPFIVTLM